MIEESEEQQGIDHEVLNEIWDLRQFQGAAKEFWVAYVGAVGRMLQASQGVLALRAREETAKWKKAYDWAPKPEVGGVVQEFLKSLERLCQDAERKGACQVVFTAAKSAGKPDDQVDAALAIRLKLNSADQVAVLAYLLKNVSRAEASDSLARLQLTADTPATYQERQANTQALADRQRFASTLDLVTQVNEQDRFLAAAMAVCNAVATGHRCDRVSLGWLEKGQVRLKAISRTENFNRRMEAAQKLEVAMEECLDQDAELVWPSAGDGGVIVNDHQAFAKDQQCGVICSLPLRDQDEPVAVLTCERSDPPFSADEMAVLRLDGDQVVRRLADLKDRDRWFGARWLSWIVDRAKGLMGPEHTLAKLIALTCVLLLAILLFWRVDYRVESNFIVRSDEVAYLTAPFDGYIKTVERRVGELVDQGGVLLGLDTDELLLQESAAIADLERYRREAERARAAGSLAEMRVAEAQAEQAEARLQLVRYRQEQARVKSPFDGVVVEGDLFERLGSPVTQGDLLFRVARVDRLFVEAKVDERDIQDVDSTGVGEVAFVSNPSEKFPVKVTRIEPAALAKNEENVFVVRCDFTGDKKPWWRPGMSGVCKIESGKRSLLWIFTHRTVDTLRMWLWW